MGFFLAALLLSHGVLGHFRGAEDRESLRADAERSDNDDQQFIEEAVDDGEDAVKNLAAPASGAANTEWWTLCAAFETEAACGARLGIAGFASYQAPKPAAKPAAAAAPAVLPATPPASATPTAMFFLTPS